MGAELLRKKDSNMSYEFYKVFHLTGIFLLMISFGGIYVNAKNETKIKWLMAFNGIGLVIALVGGFGLMARLGMMKAWPTWIFLKLGIWVVFAILPAIAMRKKVDPKLMTIITLAIGGFAVYLVNFKPFM